MLQVKKIEFVFGKDLNERLCHFRSTYMMVLAEVTK